MATEEAKKCITLQDLRKLMKGHPSKAKVQLRVTDSDDGVTTIFAQHAFVTWDAEEGEYVLQLEADASHALPRGVRGRRSVSRGRGGR